MCVKPTHQLFEIVGISKLRLTVPILDHSATLRVNKIMVFQIMLVEAFLQIVDAPILPIQIELYGPRKRGIKADFPSHNVADVILDSGERPLGGIGLQYQSLEAGISVAVEDVVVESFLAIFLTGI